MIAAQAAQVLEHLERLHALRDDPQPEAVAEADDAPDRSSSPGGAFRVRLEGTRAAVLPSAQRSGGAIGRTA
jgi:hypothetical protein